MDCRSMRGRRLRPVVEILHFFETDVPEEAYALCKII